MALSEAQDTPLIAFGEVVSALKRLGGVAHTDLISGLLVQSRGLDRQARADMQLQVRRVLAEHETSSEAAVQRVFGADSNRWRLN